MFAPVSNNDGSTLVSNGGSLRIAAIYKIDVTEEFTDVATLVSIYRPGEEPTEIEEDDQDDFLE